MHSLHNYASPISPSWGGPMPPSMNTMQPPATAANTNTALPSWRRINARHLPEFVGKTVRFVGELQSNPTEKRVRLRSVDGVDVYLTLAQSKPILTKYIEVVVTVLSAMELQQNGPIIELGNELSVNNLNESINFTFSEEFSDLFENVVLPP